MGSILLHYTQYMICTHAYSEPMSNSFKRITDVQSGHSNLKNIDIVTLMYHFNFDIIHLNIYINNIKTYDIVLFIKC